MEIRSASDTAEVEDETPLDRQPAWLTSGQYDVSKSTTCINQTSLQQKIPEQIKWKYHVLYHLNSQ
jgi:hypothetical protein